MGPSDFNKPAAASDILAEAPHLRVYGYFPHPQYAQRAHSFLIRTQLADRELK